MSILGLEIPTQRAQTATRISHPSHYHRDHRSHQPLRARFCYCHPHKIYPFLPSACQTRWNKTLVARITSQVVTLRCRFRRFQVLAGHKTVTTELSKSLLCILVTLLFNVHPPNHSTEPPNSTVKIPNSPMRIKNEGELLKLQVYGVQGPIILMTSTRVRRCVGLDMVVKAFFKAPRVIAPAAWRGATPDSTVSLSLSSRLVCVVPSPWVGTDGTLEGSIVAFLVSWDLNVGSVAGWGEIAVWVVSSHFIQGEFIALHCVIGSCAGGVGDGDALIERISPYMHVEMSWRATSCR